MKNGLYPTQQRLLFVSTDVLFHFENFMLTVNMFASQIKYNCHEERDQNRLGVINP